MATLVTGVGYIGAALLRRLAATPRAAPLVAFDNFFSTPRNEVLAALPAGVRLVEGDVADEADVARAFDALPADGATTPPTVFHLAAQPSARIAVDEPELTERSNLRGARVLLETARARGAQIVFGGSFRVYGDDLLGRTVDEAEPYGRVGDLSHLSKIYAEQLGRMLGLPFISVRLGVTYGRSPIMKTSPPLMTVPNLFCARAARGESLRVLEDRPLAFIHVEDAAAALQCAAVRLHQVAAVHSAPVFEWVNAAPEVATIGQVARAVQAVAATRGQQVCIEGATESSAGFAVASRLETEHRFKPQHAMADSLAAVYDFFADRP